jgi:hypothetical protein
MAGMVREDNCARRYILETEPLDRTTEEAQGGKAVGVDPSLITACKPHYFRVWVR